MNVREAVNRGFNLLAVSIVSLAGFAFLPEIFLEKDPPDKVDDLLLLILGIAAIVWYSKKERRVSRSFWPTAFVIMAFAVKLAGIIVEFSDPEAVGDDFGGIILLVLATGFVIYQYVKTKKLAESSVST